MRRGAIAAARHAVGVTSVMQRPPLTRAVPVNLGSGIPLDMLLGDPEVTAVSAGPVWTGGGYVETDGVLYFTGPTIDFTTPYDIVMRVSAAAAANTYYWASYYFSTSYWMRAYSAAGGQGIDLRGTSTRFVSSAALLTGSRTFQLAATGSAGALRPDLVLSGNLAAVGSGTAVGQSASLVIGAFNGAASAAGGRIWEVAVYTGVGTLSSGDRTALHNSGTQADMRGLITPQPTHYWDMSQIDASGNVWDLVAGAYNLTITGGDATDFGTGTF